MSIDSNNSFSFARQQAINQTNAGYLSIGPLGINVKFEWKDFREICVSQNIVHFFGSHIITNMQIGIWDDQYFMIYSLCLCSHFANTAIYNMANIPFGV